MREEDRAKGEEDRAKAEEDRIKAEKDRAKADFTRMTDEEIVNTAPVGAKQIEAQYDAERRLGMHGPEEQTEALKEREAEEGRTTEQLLKERLAYGRQNDTFMYYMRGKFAGAAWLLGASWAQLAITFDVRRESVMAITAKYLPPNAREPYRQVRQPITHQRVTELYSAWKDFCISSPNVADSIGCEKLALVLDKKAAHDLNEHDPYLTVGRG